LDFVCSAEVDHEGNADFGGRSGSVLERRQGKGPGKSQSDRSRCYQHGETGKPSHQCSFDGELDLSIKVLWWRAGDQPSAICW
jgi:hypothetical protein